jgi:hypothetical protein
LSPRSSDWGASGISLECKKCKWSKPLDGSRRDVNFTIKIKSLKKGLIRFR